jgi:hypothetical protein
MDGNGRWAKQNGLSRFKGHEKGVSSVREVTEACTEIGVKYLTLYAFSTENWNRPKEEVEALMTLCRADITSKNGDKVKKYLRNFDTVEEKLREVEASDSLRSFQPVFSGEVIMEVFDMGPGKEVGLIKIAIREAILDGLIRNDFASGWDFMISEGLKLDLKPVKSLDQMIS